MKAEDPMVTALIDKVNASRSRLITAARALPVWHADHDAVVTSGGGTSRGYVGGLLTVDVPDDALARELAVYTSTLGQLALAIRLQTRERALP